MPHTYSGRPLDYHHQQQQHHHHQHHQQQQQHPQHHLYSHPFSPSSTSPFQRQAMAVPPYNGSIASPGGVHIETGSSNASRLGGSSRYDEEDSSPASLNQYSPSKEMESRGTKRKSLPKKEKSEEGANKEEEQSGGGIRRKKKAVSCESCRRRKLKCDRGWPCGACRDRNEANLCKWEGGTKPQAVGRDQDNTSMYDRMSRMEDLLAVIAERVGVRPGDDSSISTQRDQSDEKSAIFAKEKSEGVVGPSTSSMLATGWLPTSIDEARSELIHVLNILPDTATVRRMCKFFFEEVDHMHYIVTDEAWDALLREHEQVRLMYQGAGPSMQSRARPDENPRSHLQFLALLLSLCALCLLFSDQDEFSEVTRNIGVSNAAGVFLDSAQKAFNASNPFEEPTILSVRFLILQFWAISIVRGLGPGMGLMAQAIHQMFALELDQEPPESMPAAERTDRIRLFHCMAVIDWFTAGSAKRTYTIREEPNKHPYLFGPKRLRDRFNSSDEIIQSHQWLKLDLARLNRRAVERSAMTETDAYNATIDIQQELDDFYVNLPSRYNIDLITELKEVNATYIERLGIPLSLSTQLISLHKRYYIQGWLDPAYRASRDICFASARRVCSIFRKALSPYLPIQDVMKMDISQAQACLEKRQNVISRLWFLSHSSVGACLLLQHHYALMEAYPSVAGPNTEQVRAEIDEDIRISKRLLLVLSPYSKIAKSGLAQLTKPETVKQAQEEVVLVSQKGGGISNQNEEMDEATRQRRAKLAMDLQSITDIDTFGPSKSKKTQDNGHDQVRSGFNGGQQYSNQSSSIPTSQSLGDLGMTSENLRDEVAEMQALLQSTFSTDLYTGLPLAPEISFQRQTDRTNVGGNISGDVYGPSTPYTASFFANFGTNMNGPNYTTGSSNGPQSLPLNNLPQPVQPVKDSNSASWY